MSAEEEKVEAEDPKDEEKEGEEKEDEEKRIDPTAEDKAVTLDEYKEAHKEEGLDDDELKAKWEELKLEEKEAIEKVEEPPPPPPPPFEEEYDEPEEPAELDPVDVPADTDLTWPSSFGEFEAFGKKCSDYLLKKGYCMVEMTADEALIQEATKQAAKDVKAYTIPKKEFLSDYLGKKPNGKVAFLKTEVPDYASMEDLKEDAISKLDRNLTNVAACLAPISMSSLGFEVVSRNKGMLWTPIGKDEKKSYEAEELIEDDIESGDLEEHLQFIQSRKICLLNVVSTEGGDILLYPSDGSAPKKMPAASNRLLIFATDSFNYAYQPTGASLVMATWVLTHAPSLKIEYRHQDLVSANMSELYGIEQGFPIPKGDRTHIMSMSARYPFKATGSSAYWNGLLAGSDGMVHIPQTRFDVDVYCTPNPDVKIPGLSYSRHGGFVEDKLIYSFDYEFFEVDFVENQVLSPQQKVYAEETYTCMAGAGYTKETLSGKDIGLFTGDTGSDWNGIVLPLVFGNPDEKIRNQQITMTAKTGNAFLTSRLACVFNLKGPISTADTACSSSLVATSMGQTFLRSRDGTGSDLTTNRYRECVAAGVSTQVGAFSYIGMCALVMISPQGRCFTFDQSGDGYARGEGCGCIYMKASDDADDTINQIACLMAAQCNQDGRSASMTAPNGPSQEAIIRMSMKEGGLTPSLIDFSECHGTGTALGDPIEVGALRNAMEPRDTVLTATSAKCHMGHLEGGAGMGGVVKCLVMLRASVCSPNAHMGELNPNLSVSGFPIIFENEAVTTGLNSALTGVSSFGFGGTNGRCDLWALCRLGTKKCGDLDKDKIGQVTSTCPITFGSIDYLSGEPVLPDKGLAFKYWADALREDFADYGVSREVYKGRFRYRQNKRTKQLPENLPKGTTAYICGSWSGYSKMEAMQTVPEKVTNDEGEEEETTKTGTYVAYVKLGETRCEKFFISLNSNKEKEVRPAIDDAHDLIYVPPPGPSTDAKWSIDGRDDCTPAGTTFKVTLSWCKYQRTVAWEKVSTEEASSATAAAPTYYVLGSFSKKPVAMELSEPGCWTTTFTIGGQQKEDFVFARDQDMSQVIYPARSTAKAGVPACGPDALSAAKRFYVVGASGEEVKLVLKVVDGKVTVTAGGTTWESSEGWARHTYSVATGKGLVPMKMTTPGIFKATVPVTEFKILVDEDPSVAIYPIVTTSSSGEYMVLGPDYGSTDQKFAIYNVVDEDPEYEVTLDLTELDRRKVVTWKKA